MYEEARIRAWSRAAAAARGRVAATGDGLRPVSDFMSRPVLSAAADARLRAARDLMHTHRIHHLLVEDRGRIVGILSDRDVVRAISPYADGPVSSARDEATLDQPIYHVASFRLHVIHRNAPIEEAAAVFVERGISALPVVDDREEICGIVTSRDALRGLLACLLPERQTGAA